MNLQNLITEEERHSLKKIALLASSIKNKYFSLGRDLDNFVKAIAAFGVSEVEKKGE